MGYWPKKLKRRRHSNHMRVFASLMLSGCTLERKYPSYWMLRLPDGTMLFRRGVSSLHEAARRLGIK
jgi:hypothetical protein